MLETVLRALDTRKEYRTRSMAPFRDADEYSGSTVSAAGGCWSAAGVPRAMAQYLLWPAWLAPSPCSAES